MKVRGVVPLVVALASAQLLARNPSVRARWVCWRVVAVSRLLKNRLFWVRLSKLCAGHTVEPKECLLFRMYSCHVYGQ